MQEMYHRIPPSADDWQLVTSRRWCWLITGFCFICTSCLVLSNIVVRSYVASFQYDGLRQGYALYLSSTYGSVCEKLSKVTSSLTTSADEVPSTGLRLKRFKSDPESILGSARRFWTVLKIFFTRSWESILERFEGLAPVEKKYYGPLADYYKRPYEPFVGFSERLYPGRDGQLPFLVKFYNTLREGTNVRFWVPQRLCDIPEDVINAVNAWHFSMLNDGPRNEFYRAALQRVIHRDSVVLEIGAGSGILSIIAAKLGARSVVAIEASEHLAAVAQEIIERNGYADRIHIINKLSTEVKPEEIAPFGAPDVLISELFGASLLAEGALHYVVDARKRLVAPHCVIVPARGRQYATLIESLDIASLTSAKSWEGIDLGWFNRFQDTTSARNTWHYHCSFSSCAHRYLSQRTTVLEVNFAHDEVLEHVTSAQLRASADGTVHAILSSWEVYADDSDDLVMGTDPETTRKNFDRDISWGQTLQLIEDSTAPGAVPVPFVVSKGELLELTTRFDASWREMQFHLARLRKDVGLSLIDASDSHGHPRAPVAAETPWPNVTFASHLAPGFWAPPRLHNLSCHLIRSLNDWLFPSLNDHGRLEFYRVALQRIVDRDSVVLEIGAGCGWISVVAASLGVRSVIAIEADENLAEVARDFAQHSGYGDRIHVITGISGEVSPEQIAPFGVPNVLVSEMFDSELLGQEAALHLWDARKRLCHPVDCVVVPLRGKQFAALVEAPRLARLTSVTSWEGIDLELFNQFQDTASLVPTISTNCRFSSCAHRYLSPRLLVFDVNFEYDTADKWLKANPVQFRASANGTVHAVLASWEVYADGNDDLTMATHPETTQNNLPRDVTWGQSVQVIEDSKAPGVGPVPFVVTEGELLELTTLVSYDGDETQFRLNRVQEDGERKRKEQEGRMEETGRKMAEGPRRRKGGGCKTPKSSMGKRSTRTRPTAM